MTTDTLHKLQDIFEDHEKACDLEGVFVNYAEGKNVVVLMSVEDYKEFYGVGELRKRYPQNSAHNIPDELAARIRKLIDQYESEQYKKIEDVKVSNLPWEELF